jgi:hypothetical protein
MPTTITLLTERLLNLAVGKSCVANVRRADAYIRSARKHAPDRQWLSQSMDGGWVITRTR